MRSELIDVRTGSQETVHDLTAECERFVIDLATGRGGTSGPADPVPAICPPYATVPVVGGRLALGIWQAICLVDLNGDNPVRQVRLSFLAA